MNTDTNNTTTPPGAYRPKLAFYHATPKGTGCAVTWALHPAHDDADGSIWLRVANQMTVGNRVGPNPTFPTFDWENAMTVKFDFNDLCQVLQVLRGECESVNGEKGLFHRAPCGMTNIRFSHLVDPTPGYRLEVYRSSRPGGAEDAHAQLTFGSAEALGLCEAIAGSMYLVGFGIPMLVPHDTATYRREARDVAA